MYGGSKQRRELNVKYICQEQNEYSIRFIQMQSALGMTARGFSEASPITVSAVAVMDRAALCHRTSPKLPRDAFKGHTHVCTHTYTCTCKENTWTSSHVPAAHNVTQTNCEP